MVFHRERYEMSTAYDDSTPISSDDILKSHSGKDSNTSSASSGVQKYKVGTVTSGLLALLQLGLIIYLALSAEVHKGQNGETSELKMNKFGIQANLKNLTEEREQLLKTISNVEANNKNLTEERKQLFRTISNVEANNKNLTEEREQLFRTISNVEANNKNVSEERDDLKRALNDFTLQLKSLDKERNKLEMRNFDIEARNKNLTEERVDLESKLNDLDSKHQSVTDERKRMKTKLNIIAQPGWRLSRGRAYYISSTKNTWQESRNDCQSKGADLMIIDSKEEQDFANSLQMYMWIGLTDSETEGTWMWVDGSPLTTSYWSENEPNGKTGENCGNIKTFTTERSWNDERCSLSLNWICEMKLTQ